MIKTSIKDEQAWVLLDRPKYKNALNIALLECLLSELKTLENNPEIKVIVLYGEPNFSSGGDIRDMQVNNFAEAKNMAQKVQAVYADIERISKPIIAYVSGYVLGGGFELALVCDFIVADSSACFALPETALGIVPGGGATQRLKQRIGKQNAAFILMTGKRFTANEMYSLGIVQSIIENREEVVLIAQSITKNCSIATFEIKSLLRCHLDFDAESKSFAKLLSKNDNRLIQSFLNR